ncbi:MAG: hypothetical protein EOS21_06710 [Mesorhizobium sp.]|nr:MAG: hypothetical protein EOS21_06710 [Mesorhizobium sp.]
MAPTTSTIWPGICAAGIIDACGPRRAALVTGASRGIGRALAKGLAEAGFGATINAICPGWVFTKNICAS